jgi:hypothetical protein
MLLNGQELSIEFSKGYLMMTLHEEFLFLPECLRAKPDWLGFKDKEEDFVVY